MLQLGCKRYESGMKLPSWWKNSDFIERIELASLPIFLDEKAKLIDEYIRGLEKWMIT